MTDSADIYDLIGLGFGPSNIAVGGAIIERRDAPSNDTEKSFQKVLFIEKHPSFQWHPGMLLPGAQMQISFMKDLATLRSPQSPLTFLNYLHAHNRLSSFVNRGSFTPSRKEFADYLGWAARYVEEHGVSVNYGQEVVAIDESLDGFITVTSRTASDGKLHSFITRNLIISPGGSARFPNVAASLLKEARIQERSTLIHSSEYKTRVDQLFLSLASETPRPLRIAVIGGGQSAAEVTLNLQDRLSSIPAGKGTDGHQIDMIIRKGSLKPSDDTAFSNEIFDPESTSAWFGTHQQGRERIMAEYKPTNYSVVNPRTIEVLYETIYDQKVDDAIAARATKASTPRPHINIRSHMHIPSLKYNDSTKTFSFTLQHMRDRELFENEEYDAVVCATGYQRNTWIQMLRSSERLGRRFGVEPSLGQPAPVRLTPFAQRVANTTLESGSESDRVPELDDDSGSVSTTTTAITTPPASPSTDDKAPAEQEVKLYITRSYRLLPMTSTRNVQEQDASADGLKARIYLQGMEETTHGLSDTLLSVMGCRSGEVVDDLFSRE